MSQQNLIEIDAEYNYIYSDAYIDQNRYLIIYGSAGSGKSRFIAQKIVGRCVENKERILCVRKVDRTIKESVFKEIETVIDTIPISVKKNKTLNSFIFPNGSEIITSGLDDVKKLKSISGLTSIWIEEATDLEESDFNQIDLRLRGTPQTYFQIVISFNPIDDSHWIKKRFFDQVVPDCTILHTTYKHNKFLDEGYIKLLEETLKYDEQMYKCYVLGIWAHYKTGGEFYAQFKYNKHVKELSFKHDLALHVTFDQNVVPYITGIIAQIERIEDVYNVYFLNEFCLSNPRNTTEHLCKEILDHYEGNIQALYYYGDASGRKRDTRENINDYEIVEKVFRKYIQPQSCRVPHSNPGVPKRRKFINRIFAETLPIRIYVDPRCKNLIRDFEEVKEDVDGTKFKKKKLDKITGQAYEDIGHCFVGNTIITTLKGDKRIDKITNKDYVLTRKGFKRVLWAGITGTDRIVRKYKIGTKIIECTPDHKIFANNDFLCINNLTNKIICCIFVEKTTWKNKLLLWMDTLLTGILNQKGYPIKGILRDGLNEKKLAYIDTFGSNIMEKYLMDFMFIIRIVIGIITIYLTLSCFQLKNTLKNIMTKAVKNTKIYLKKMLPKLLIHYPKNGIDQKKENYGIKNTQKHHSLVMKEALYVVNVVNNLLQNLKLEDYIVVQNVKIDSICEKIDCLENGMKKENVNYVIKNLNLINGIEQNVVVVNVQQLSEKKAKLVYDITVEDQHEYFANGILVHNCSDSIDYLLCSAFQKYFYEI